MAAPSPLEWRGWSCVCPSPGHCGLPGWPTCRWGPGRSCGRAPPHLARCGAERSTGAAAAAAWASQCSRAHPLALSGMDAPDAAPEHGTRKITQMSLAQRQKCCMGRDDGVLGFHFSFLYFHNSMMAIVFQKFLTANDAHCHHDRPRAKRLSMHCDTHMTHSKSLLITEKGPKPSISLSLMTVTDQTDHL